MEHNEQMALSRAVAQSKRTGEAVSLDWEDEKIDEVVEYLEEVHEGHLDATPQKDGSTAVDAWTPGMPDGQYDFRLCFVPVSSTHEA